MFYALYDNQTGRYLASGLNSRSIAELAQAYRDYTMIDREPEDEYFFANATDKEILNAAHANSLLLEEGEEAFPDEFDGEVLGFAMNHVIPVEMRSEPYHELTYHYDAKGVSKRNPRLRALTERPSNKSRNSPCPCGSGMKYKKCCKL